MSKNIDQNTTRPASVKLDHGEVIRLLKPLGDPEAAEGFYYDIEFLLDIDCKEYSKRASNKTQHEKLVEILEKSNSLLKLLQELRFNEDSIINTKNLQIATLISNHVVFSRLKNKSQEASYETVPFNYPTALIDSLQEMRDAVALASAEVKQKRGNSSQRDPEAMRKKILAIMFVQSYFRRFKKPPSISEKGAAHQVLIRLFYAANISGEYFLHQIRYAIKYLKDIPTSKREILKDGTI